jgi:hypothetical protein
VVTNDLRAVAAMRKPKLPGPDSSTVARAPRNRECWAVFPSNRLLRQVLSALSGGGHLNQLSQYEQGKGKVRTLRCRRQVVARRLTQTAHRRQDRRRHQEAAMQTTVRGCSGIRQRRRKDLRRRSGRRGRAYHSCRCIRISRLTSRRARRISGGNPRRRWTGCGGRR